MATVKKCVDQMVKLLQQAGVDQNEIDALLGTGAPDPVKLLGQRLQKVNKDNGGTDPIGTCHFTCDGVEKFCLMTLSQCQSFCSCDPDTDWDGNRVCDPAAS